MHPNRLHFVVHVPSCLHDLFCVMRPLHSNRGDEGTVTWGMCLWGWEDTVARRRLLCRGRGYRWLWRFSDSNTGGLPPLLICDSPPSFEYRDPQKGFLVEGMHLVPVPEQGGQYMGWMCEA